MAKLWAAVDKISMKTLVTIAAGGGILISVTNLAFDKLIQDKIKKCAVYTEAMETIETHPAASKLLGTPIETSRVQINDKLVLKETESSWELPVHGPQNKGILYVKADRLNLKDKWNIYNMELEITDERGGRLSIVNKKPVLVKEEKK